MMMKGGSSKRRTVVQEKEISPNISTDEGVQSPSPTAKVKTPERIQKEPEIVQHPAKVDYDFSRIKSVEDIDFMYVYLRDLWKEVAKVFKGSITEDDLFLKSRKLWFEKTFSKSDKKSKAEPDLLIKPHYIYSREEVDELQKRPKSFVTVIKNFMDKINLNNGLFDIDFIQQKYGEYYTDIRVQTPLIEGFNLRNSKYLQEIDEMKVDDYIKYQKSKRSMYLLDASTLDDTIKFAVNLDIGNFEEQLSELYNKVPSWIYCNRDGDLQSYLRKHIPGMTVPQIYLKVAGCWTGGHQENLSLRAVNINHGPGEVEWYCMEVDEAYRFNDYIMLEKNLNFLKLEGLWYIPLEEVLRRGFKVSKFVQQTGDIVVLAPGTLHWVRSYSHTVNSAWNLGEMNELQIKELLRRYDFNVRFHFRNLIPVKTLCLDLMNNAADKLDSIAFEILKARVLSFLEESLNLMKTIESLASQIEPDNLEINNMVMCSKCFGETFESWFYNDSNDKTEFDVESILCYKCASKVKRAEKLTCFIKYSEANIKHFMHKISGLNFKSAKKESYPLFPAFATPKFYIKSTVSEYYQEKHGKLVPLASDPISFEDPLNLVKEKFYLSRKSTTSANIFDKDALMYKIKKKEKLDIPEEIYPVNELSLIEQKVKNRFPGLVLPSDKPKPSEKTDLKTEVVKKAFEFFCKYEKNKLGIQVIEELYAEFSRDVKNSSGSIATLRSILKEDTFTDEFPLLMQKANCIFLFLEGKLNPEESMFILVEDKDINDKELFQKLQSVIAN